VALGGGKAEDSTVLEGAGVKGSGATSDRRGVERNVSSGRSEPSRELDSQAPRSSASAAMVVPLTSTALLRNGLTVSAKPIIPNSPFPSRPAAA
jgi:hypothetical protein